MQQGKDKNMPTEEHHSWFESTFGFNPGKALGGAVKTVDDAESAALKTAEKVIPGFKTLEGLVESGAKTVEKTVIGGVQKFNGAAGKPVTGAKQPAQPSPSVGGGAGGVLSLTGSVGRGGKNKPDEVKAVQRSLGLNDDGKCGTGTITAIEKFQKSLGQTRPDGRIDPGGPTARALSSSKNGLAAKPEAQKNEVSPQKSVFGGNLSGFETLLRSNLNILQTVKSVSDTPRAGGVLDRFLPPCAIEFGKAVFALKEVIEDIHAIGEVIGEAEILGPFDVPIVIAMVLGAIKAGDEAVELEQAYVECVDHHPSDAFGRDVVAKLRPQIDFMNRNLEALRKFASEHGKGPLKKP
jgi:hypothetical protein